MKTKSADLQGGDEVDMFGLDEFGAPSGLGQKWGAAIGVGLQAGGAWAVRSLMPSMRGKSELIGAVAGVAGGAIMMAKTSTRAAGWTALTASLIGGGIRVLEQLFSDAPPISFEGVVVTPTQTMQGVVVSPTQTLGLTTFAPTQAFQGARPQLVGARPQLVGAMGERAQQVVLNGGPAVSGLAGRYGATLFGGGN